MKKIMLFLILLLTVGCTQRDNFDICKKSCLTKYGDSVDEVILTGASVNCLCELEDGRTLDGWGFDVKGQVPDNFTEAAGEMISMESTASFPKTCNADCNNGVVFEFDVNIEPKNDRLYVPFEPKAKDCNITCSEAPEK